MRELIAKKLEEMHSTTERAILREVMNDVFLPMYDEIERKYAELEQRVRDELPFLYDTYTIYCTVMHRNQIAGHSFLSPVFPEKAHESALNTRDLAEAISCDSAPIIETVFFEADYLKCQRLIRDKQIFDGAFIIQSERYPFKCRLEPAEQYSKVTEVLYSAFAKNGVPWTTVNVAYLNKFFNVCMTDILRELPKNSSINMNQIEICFEPYNESILRELIPVWNIDTFHVTGEDYPMPALDAVNYEYHFTIESLGSENGYLVDYDSSYILHTHRESDILVVTSPQKNRLAWNMYRFRQKQYSSIDAYPYPVLSNSRKDSFSSRLMLHYGTHISTRAEMRKLINSLDASEHMELTDFQFAGEKTVGDTYDMNSFIRNEIRDPNHQKTLVLSFTPKQREFFLNRDIMSFLVSEFQATFPEYHCVGALL